PWPLPAFASGTARKPRHQGGRGDERAGRQRHGPSPRDSSVDPLPGGGEDFLVGAVESLIHTIQDRLHPFVKGGWIRGQGPVERLVKAEHLLRAGAAGLAPAEMRGRVRGGRLVSP